MFQWQITLSDRQVIMLTAFNMAEPDKHGSIFHSAHSMMADAWDTRSVRKLEEMNLIVVTKTPTQNIWAITEKGRFIARAIVCDADNLRRLKLRRGSEMRSLVNTDCSEITKRRKRKQASVLKEP